MHAEHLDERCGVKIAVSLHRDARHPSAQPQTHLVEDRHLVGVGSLLFMLHLRIEIALALVIVPQAAIALVQQVLVHAALLEDRNHPAEVIRVDACSLDLHLDDRPPVGGKPVIDSLRLRVELLGFELDLSFQPLLALVILEHPGQGPVAGFAVHERTGFQVRMGPEGLPAHARVACHLQGAHARLPPGDDVKGNVNELLPWMC